LGRAFARLTQAQLEAELRGSPPPLTPDDYGAAFGRFATYLRACEDGGLEMGDRDEEIGALTDAWARALGGAGAPPPRPPVEAYVATMERAHWTCDAELEARVRASLARVSPAERELGALVRGGNERLRPIGRDTLFAGTKLGALITSRASPERIVVGAYT